MKKAKKSGKKLEKLISMIHESLKDSPYTVIHSNYKIPNNGGRKREIDVLIESKVNDIPIKIAIECKEYSKPVSVEKIEAFKGKCDRITDINKKIFVSQNGYQADAINAAKEFGIDLYTVKEINTATIKDWFPQIRQLELVFELNPTVIRINAEVNENLITKDDLFHFYQDKESVNKEFFIHNIVKEGSRQLWQIALSQFINRNCKELGKKINVEVDATLNGVFVISDTDERLPVVGFKSSVDIWFEEKNIKIEEANSLVDSSGEIKANNIAIPIGESKANIIISKDKYSIFHTDENGLTAELKTLMTFNPNSNQDNET